MGPKGIYNNDSRGQKHPETRNMTLNLNLKYTVTVSTGQEKMNQIVDTVKESDVNSDGGCDGE